jgi:hypothetical protein
MPGFNSAKVFFFDEARFGTHSKIGHGWFKRGIRSRIRIKLYKNFYVYTAVSPKDGDEFSLILPKVNTDFMNVFLAEMAGKHVNEKVLLIMDGAGWHKSKKLVVPESIKIIFLPAYSPTP